MVIKWFKRKPVEEADRVDGHDAVDGNGPEAGPAEPSPPPVDVTAEPTPFSPETADTGSSLFDEDDSLAAEVTSGTIPESFDEVVTLGEGEPELSQEEVQAEIEAEVAATDERRAAADAAQAAWDSAEAEAEGLFQKLREGLSRTQDAFVGQLKDVLRLKDKVDDELLDDIEDILIQADVGARSADMIRERLAKMGREQEVYDPDALSELVQGSILEILEQGQRPLRVPSRGPIIYLVVGVNGTGKTTSIGKLALEFARQGKSVMLIAADTFRAAAVEQLGIWAERTGACLVSSEREGADPASVCFEGLAEAVKSNPDVVLIDTAGRLHTKKYLMDELEKIVRVIKKLFPKHRTKPSSSLMQPRVKMRSAR